jgi:uncharacterized protein YndB with AHSA1/START domain
LEDAVNLAQTRSIAIDAPPQAVVELLADGNRLPQWAPAFAGEMRAEGDDWLVGSGEGEFRIRIRSSTELGRMLLDAGMTDTVREFRQKLENLMAERLVGTVEQLTDRRVLTYQSQILFDPEVVVEMFVFDRPLERSVLQETAEAVLANDDVPGARRGSGRARGSR